MKKTTEDKMRNYLNASSMTSLLRGHCEVLRKNLKTNFTSIVLQANELSLGFVIPEQFRNYFNENLLDLFFRITKMQHNQSLTLLNELKKQLKSDSKEFDIL